MQNPDRGIFSSPYRMHVINALKQATGIVLDRNLPTTITNAAEIGCGTGAFYQQFAPDRLKAVLTGFDNHAPSLEIFRQLSPEARMSVALANRLAVLDADLDTVIGFSAYPLLTKEGVIKELARVVRPGGRVIAFQDSFIGGHWDLKDTYENMQKVELHHTLMKQKFSRREWQFIDGYDPIEAVIVSSQDQLLSHLAPDIRSKMKSGQIVIATSNDTGWNKVWIDSLGNAENKYAEFRDALGNPRVLDTVMPKFGEEAVEYVRLRYFAAEKRS